MIFLWNNNEKPLMAMADHSARLPIRMILAIILGGSAVMLAWIRRPEHQESPAIVARMTSSPSVPSEVPSPTSFPDFELLDHFGNPYSLKKLRDQHRLVAVVFWGCDCPLVRLYTRTLHELSREFGPKGLAVVAINSNVQDSPTDITRFVEVEGASFPILKDLGQEIADAAGAKRTPEAFLLSSEGVILYRGRIDDQFGIGYRQSAPKESYLKQAINQYLGGQKITLSRTEPVGCLIGRAHKASSQGSVTFTKDIAPILRERCQECHRDGEVAPFPLTDYQHAYGWAEMIREVVEQERMPPWFAAGERGHFRNDARLTLDEKKTLLAWIDDGCPQGDPKDLPTPRPFLSGWTIPQPDLVLAIADRPVKVPAHGPYEYQSFYIDPKLTEDKWIVAAEARPGNRKVVHHIAIWILRDGLAKDDYSTSPSIAFAPGMPALTYPEGAALRLPKGATIRYQIHYEPCGYETEDRSTLGLKFCDPSQVKSQVLIDAIFPNDPIAIPPHQPAHQMQGYHYFGRDAILFALMPHMHLRGKSYRYTLIRPDQSREVLLDMPRWDFGWQFWYLMPQPIQIPKGSLLEAETVFDNSPTNQANPDATQLVHWGPKTTDEMTVGVFAAIDPASQMMDQSQYVPPLEGFGALVQTAWQLIPSNGATATLLRGPHLYTEQSVRIDQPGGSPHDVRLVRPVHPVFEGRSYCMQFRIRSSIARTIEFGIRSADTDSTDVGLWKTLTIGPHQQYVRHEFYATGDASQAQLEFDLGKEAGQIDLDGVVLLQGFHR
jgi:peroxiredoxin